MIGYIILGVIIVFSAVIISEKNEYKVRIKELEIEKELFLKGFKKVYHKWNEVEHYHWEKVKD